MLIRMSAKKLYYKKDHYQKDYYQRDHCKEIFEENCNEETHKCLEIISRHCYGFYSFTVLQFYSFYRCYEYQIGQTYQID